MEYIFCCLIVARMLVNADNKHETQNVGSSKALCSRQDVSRTSVLTRVSMSHGAA